MTIQERVCYYSKYDLSLGHNLEMAEKRIQEISDGAVPSKLEDVIELWHIKEMIKDGCRLIRWSDTEYEHLKTSTCNFNEAIAKFFSSLDLETIKIEFDSLNWQYEKTFWEIIDSYKRYELISQ